MANILYWKNDTLLKVTGLKNPVTGDFINNATATAVVKDKYGANVAGQTWPLTVGYVAASDGNYQGIIEAALDVAVGDHVSVEVTITAAGGLEAFFKLPTEVRQRGKVQ